MLIYVPKKMKEKILNRDILQAAIENGRIEWQRHALERILERDISREDVFNVLLTGEEIEEYANDTPFPSALLFGWKGNERSMSSWPLIQSANRDTLLLSTVQISNISIRILGHGGNVDTKSPAISMPALWRHKKTRHNHLYGRVGIWHRRGPKCAGFTLLNVWS